MTTWNYRVLRYQSGDVGIHEVYYDDDGKAVSCTVDEIGAMGADLDELRSDLEHMMRALSLPVLDYDAFGKDAEPNTVGRQKQGGASIHRSLGSAQLV